MARAVQEEEGRELGAARELRLIAALDTTYLGQGDSSGVWCMGAGCGVWCIVAG